MEIKKINPLTFPNFDKYLLELPVNDIKELGDIYSIIDNNVLYLITKCNNEYIFICENDNLLTTFSYENDLMREIISFKDDEFEYNFEKKDDYNSIVRNNLSTSDSDILLCSKDVDGNSYMEYRQFIYDLFSGLVFRYNVSNHNKDLSTIFSYAYYNLPDQLELHKSVGKIFPRQKLYFYFKDYKDSSKYRRAYIVNDKSFHISSWNNYDGNLLIKYICEDLKFRERIDDDMYNLLVKSNNTLNKGKELILNCKNYINGQY